MGVRFKREEKGKDEKGIILASARKRDSDRLRPR